MATSFAGIDLVEHLWDMMERRLSSLHEIPQKDVNHLILPMLRPEKENIWNRQSYYYFLAYHVIRI